MDNEQTTQTSNKIYQLHVDFYEDEADLVDFLTAQNNRNLTIKTLIRIAQTQKGDADLIDSMVHQVSASFLPLNGAGSANVMPTPAPTPALEEKQEKPKEVKKPKKAKKEKKASTKQDQTDDSSNDDKIDPSQYVGFDYFNQDY